ncbi:MAG TPA: ATP-binding protein [Accumulibacter sp.]|nr:ATP-binding protein [Accumulibacter sp.]HRE72644.1 ATP-binding protein [Accumulibacter sp.]
MKQDEPAAVLDPKQLSRIEGVHRGFMYQHLFAAGCLLVAHGHATAVCVEKDEDIEIVSGGRATYIQVKTRSKPLIHSDIKGALQRFAELREEHASGRRSAKAEFVLVSNVAPAPALLALAQRGQFPPDVSMTWPEGAIGLRVDGLPPAWPDIPTAAAWCTAAAERLPQRIITAEVLVWKIAAHVALAASGTAPYRNHSFQVAELPTLFEQILLQLQDFPELLQHYRPQQDEPALDSAAHLRIVCGFSGAGKTTWAAQAAAHSGSGCAYYDAADIPAAALAAALVRECAAQLAGSGTLPLDSVLAPGVTGLESLRGLDKGLCRAGRPAILVIDNAHSLPATALQKVVQATRHIRLILLCHPLPMVAELEALTGVKREDLKGWSLEDVAAEAAALECRGSIDAMERLRVLTGGYPLFVQGAARLAAAEYVGDVAALCASVENGIHTAATAQEVILARIFNALEPSQCHAAGLLSFSDVSLCRSEVIRLLREGMAIEEPAAAAILRQLRLVGLVQISGADRVRVHDAIRVLGKAYVRLLGADSTKKGLESLKEIIFKSLHEQRDSSRFGAFARLLASLNYLEPLVELIGEELFHEIGVIPEVTAALEHALASGELTPSQQYWAYDGLVFAAMKHGGQGVQKNLQRWLGAMEKLLRQGVLTRNQKAALWMKRMHYEAVTGNAKGALQAHERAKSVLRDDKAYVRVFNYNAAAALYRLESYELAEHLVQELISEYYALLVIEPDQVTELSQEELWKAISTPDLDIQDVKHLADALELLAMVCAKQEKFLPFARIHATRFYEIAGAVDSVVRTGLDVADDFVRMNDFLGARQFMERTVLPYIQQHRLISKLLDARSLYAVILAYSGEFDDAELEMARIAPLVEDSPIAMQEQIAAQLLRPALIRRPRAKLFEVETMAESHAAAGRSAPATAWDKGTTGEEAEGSAKGLRDRTDSSVAGGSGVVARRNGSRKRRQAGAGIH